MKAGYFLTLLTVLSFNTAQALTLEAGKWYDFEGLIGKAKVQLSLFLLNNGQLKGNYCYHTYERKILLSGNMTGDQIVLTEHTADGTMARLKGALASDSADHFDGTWEDMEGIKSFPFRLTLRSISGSSYVNRYSGFLYGSDQDVEDFMKQVKSAILKGDKNWVAAHLHYPIRVSLNGQEDITLKNKEQLIVNFEAVFYPEFKEQIKGFCSCNLFVNYQGAMLGNGQIWINQTPKSTMEKHSYRITAINN